MKVVAVANQKGGVGKTILSFNLAKGLAKRGFKTLAIDNDPQGNLTSAFLEDPGELKADIFNFYNDNYDVTPQQVTENLDLIGTSLSLAKANSSGDLATVFKLQEGIENLKNNYDFIIIDCLPSFGNLTTAVLVASDYVLIPTTLEQFSSEGLSDFMELVEMNRKRMKSKLKILGVVINKYIAQKRNFAREAEKILKEVYGELLFKNKLNLAVVVNESPSFNQSIQEYDAKSKSADQMNKIIREFIGRING